MILKTPSQLARLLVQARTVAMVGASDNPLRPSYTVFSYLRTQHRFDVAPINPRLNGIDGIPAFQSLWAYTAARGAPDIVDVFRKPADLVGVVNEAIAVGAKSIWFQYGVVSEAATRLADDAGLDVVVDRCIKVESARLHGDLATAGLNSGRITSRLRAAG